MAEMSEGLPTSGLASPLAQFYIPATTSLQERRPRTLKHGDTFAVLDPNGDVISGPGSPEGLFHCDTRYLSHLDVSLGGVRPMLLSSTVREDNAFLTCDLTNPDLFLEGELALERDLLHLRRVKFLWEGSCFEHISLRNFGSAAVDVPLAIRLAADFADLFEVRGTRRPKRGRLEDPQVGRDELTFSYVGLDEVRRATVVRFEPSPATLDAGSVLYRVRLARGDRFDLHLSVTCGDRTLGGDLRRAYLGAARDARRALRRSSSRAAAVESSNEIFNEGLRRSVADTYMLLTDTNYGPYPYAGIPWFNAAFGRDALITAMMTLWFDPAIARGVLRYLAANQATAEDPAADAQPGKILHEVRHGEMAALREVPFARYYGSVDSTPLFVWLAGLCVRRTGDLAFARELWPAIERALGWIDRYGDQDRDGFVEYGRATEQGLANQGWKDSHDSIFHADGTLARGPIALCEVQAYVHAAKLEAANLARLLGDAARASALEREAAELARRFNEAFWCDELGLYALALDGDKRACRVRASNTGHALLTSFVPPERAARIAPQLVQAPLFSGWGVRTVAAGEARYNPMSYHNGSVWPHDNALIARGLAGHGYKQAAATILAGLFDASVQIDLRRLPELFCGFPRRRREGPTFYPVACSPQAWAAAAPLSLLQSCLGLDFDVPNGTVVFDRPCLPSFVKSITLRGLSVGDASIDVALQGVDSQVAVHVLGRRGDIRVNVLS